MRKVMLLGLVLVALLASVPQVFAASIWVTDTDDNPKDRFLVGEAVKVHAYFSLTPYDIEVWTSEDDGGSWDHETGKDITCPAASYEAVHYDLSEAPPGRIYMLKICGSCICYAISSHLVIPELPFGSISAILASFAGFVWMGIRKRPRS